MSESTSLPEGTPPPPESTSAPPEGTPAPPEGTPDDLSEYRALLVAAQREAQQEYDKAVLALSGGAIGVSFAFIDKLAPQPVTLPSLLVLSWAAWGLSVASVLFSFFFSQLSLREAIRQVDKRVVRKFKPGGKYSTATAVLNACGGGLFLLGVILIAIFVWKNLR